MIKNIFNGIRAYGRSFQLISKLDLWKYFGIPVLISLITATAIGISAWTWSDNIGDLISKLWIWEWGSETFNTIMDVFGALVIIVIGLVLYKHVVMALSAPFMSPVSEKIETHLLGETYEQKPARFWSLLWRGIRINARNLLMELLLTVPILLIGLIPILGLISPFLLFATQAYYAGFGNMDYTLERHLKYADSVKFVKAHRGVAIGNGIVFMLMLFIPVFGVILVLPFSVTAATSETIQVLNAPQEK